MRGLRLPILGILGVVMLIVVYTATFIVTERDQAIVLRFGEIRRIIKEPGLYFKIPTSIIDTVQLMDRRLLSLHLNNKRVQVSDSRRFVVDAFATYRISDPRKFRELVSGNIALVESRMEPRLESAIRRVYGLREFDAALSEQRAEMMYEVRDQLIPQARELGLTIVDVRVQRTDLLPEVSQQAFERMRSERLAEAASLRATGTQEKLRIQAEANRKAVVIVAEAQRDSEILRGEGEGERNKLFADAFSQDPEFFEFYRTMKAYETAISDTGTTMVLSPDSDFFKFFGTDTVKPDNSPADAPAPAQ